MPAKLHPAEFHQRYLPEPNSGCWLWTGPVSKGYGTFGGRRTEGGWLAHRRSYEMHIGPIPNGLFVCHRCDTKCCVNPDHLFLGTNQDNILDYKAKGGVMGNGYAARTHCIHGHAFTFENTHRWRNERHCRICANQRKRASRARHRVPRR